LRILVVEDDFFIASQLASEIRSFGDEVVGPFAEAGDTSERIGLADAAILDIQLRSGTSFGIADRLHLAQVPFLFLTAGGTRPMPERFRGAGLYHKPGDTDELLSDLHGRLALQDHEPVPEAPSLESVVAELLLHARQRMPDAGSAERVVEVALRAAIARVEQGHDTPDMRRLLLRLVNLECGTRPHSHLH